MHTSDQVIHLTKPVQKQERLPVLNRLLRRSKGLSSLQVCGGEPQIKPNSALSVILLLLPLVYISPPRGAGHRLIELVNDLS